MAHWWATAHKSDGPLLVISILIDEDNSTKIAQSISQQGHRPLFSLKMDHIPEKAEKP